MPYTKRTNKKRPVRRRRRKYKPSPRRAILSGFPTSKLVKLRYVDSTATLDAAVGSSSSIVYRANSVYDPYYAAGGHQPMGFDQWAAIYSRYTVLGAKITVRPTPTATPSVIPMYYGVTLSGSANPLGNYSTIDNILESKLTANKRLIALHPAGPSDSRQMGMSVVQKFSAKKFFGVADVQDGAALSAVVSDNPAKDAFFGVWAAAIDGNDPGSMSFNVQIDYIVLFREPTNLNGS